jgi:hypothetical protein
MTIKLWTNVPHLRVDVFMMDHARHDSLAAHAYQEALKEYASEVRAGTDNAVDRRAAEILKQWGVEP